MPQRVTDAFGRLWKNPEALAFLRAKYPWRDEDIVDANLGLESDRFLFPSHQGDDDWRYTTRQWAGEGPRYKHDLPSPQVYIPNLARFRATDNAWVCEGHSDTVTAMSLGLPAIGMVGTSTFGQVLPFLDGKKRVVLVFDADEAGWKATRNAFNVLLETDLEIGVVILPPDTWNLGAKGWGTPEFEKAYTALGWDLSSFTAKYGREWAQDVLTNPWTGPGLRWLKNKPQPKYEPRRVGESRGVDFVALVRGLVCGRACACAIPERRGFGVTHCPAHADTSPSLSVKQRNDVVLVHCFGGCDQMSVVRALMDRGLWKKGETSEPNTLAGGTRGRESRGVGGSADGGSGPSRAGLPEAGALSQP